MSQPAFAAALDQALGELEALGAELDRADPDDLARLGGLLERRHLAVAGVHSRLQQGATLAGDQAMRLQRVWQGGQHAEERMKLAAAGTRHQLQELHRAAWHARALSADLGPRPESQMVDIEA